MCASPPFSPSHPAPCNGSSEVCESPSRDDNDDAFDTHFDNRLHMPNSGISEFQLQFQFRFRVRRMSSLTLPINFVLNWVLNAGRRQKAAGSSSSSRCQPTRRPSPHTPLPMSDPLLLLLPLPLLQLLWRRLSSDPSQQMRPMCNRARSSLWHLRSSPFSLLSFLPPLPSAGHNSSVVANLLCPILNRCSRRFLYCPVFVLLYSSHSSSILAQFELGLEINKFHMLVGHTHTSH